MLAGNASLWILQHEGFLLKVAKGFLQNFRWRRLADKNGPRKLLILELTPDFGKAVQLNRKGTDISCESLVEFPPITPNLSMTVEALESVVQDLPGETYYVAALVRSAQAQVRLLSFPGNTTNPSEMQAQVRQALGADESSMVRYQVLRKADSEKNEQLVLAASMPQEFVDNFHQALTQEGFVPVSLLPSGAAVADLARRHQVNVDNKVVGYLEVGNHASMLFLFVDHQPVLARQFKVGVADIVGTLEESFELDYATAAKLFMSGSFDFSGNIGTSINSWLHQVGISLDFVERRFGSQLEKVFVLDSATGNGAGVLAKLFERAVKRNFEPWRFLESLDGLTFGTGFHDGIRNVDFLEVADEEEQEAQQDLDLAQVVALPLAQGVSFMSNAMQEGTE
jgi:hypothetical protein